MCRWLAFLILAAMPPAPTRAETVFDHSAFDALLKARVVKGMVDYDAFRAAPEFSKYLDSLAKFDPAQLPVPERLAYWINAYNAYTIQLILSHNERQSIRNINKTAFIKGHGPWREKLVKAGGQVYHLDNVEHDILGLGDPVGNFPKQLPKEPRIHFALVCAAMGCPPLRSEAYTGAKLESQLAEQARVFLLETPSKNRVDVKAATAYGSPIYVKYYRDDFGKTDEAIGKYLAGFYPDGPEKKLLLSGKFKLVETEYDWTLNSQENTKKLNPAKR